MVARLSTENTTDKNVASLRKRFATVADNTSRADLDAYSDLNIAFQQAIIALSISPIAGDDDRVMVDPYGRCMGAEQQCKRQRAAVNH